MMEIVKNIAGTLCIIAVAILIVSVVGVLIRKIALVAIGAFMLVIAWKDASFMSLGGVIFLFIGGYICFEVCRGLWERFSSTYKTQ
jgi:hypothetical protein